MYTTNRAPRIDVRVMFLKEIADKGLRATRRGMPYLVFGSDGEFMNAVFVTSSRRTRLKRKQWEVVKVLLQHNVPCQLWSPEEGFQKV